MRRPDGRTLDAVALALAGLINTALAAADYALLLKPGTSGSGVGVGARAEWIAAHAGRWQAGWSFWIVVTTTFAWGFFALGRHLSREPAWAALAIGAALLAAAVDIVGIVVNIAVLPELAVHGGTDAFHGAQLLAEALTDVAAFGLYTLAGVLMLPALHCTPGAPRALLRVGACAWGVSAVATVFLALGVDAGRAVGTVALLLFVPWAWLGARWLLRTRPR